MPATPWFDAGYRAADRRSRAAERRAYWRQQTGLDVEVADDAFVVRIKQRTSSIDGIRSRQTGTCEETTESTPRCYERLTTEHTANDFATFFSDKDEPV